MKKQKSYFSLFFNEKEATNNELQNSTPNRRELQREKSEKVWLKEA